MPEKTVETYAKNLTDIETLDSALTQNFPTDVTGNAIREHVNNHALEGDPEEAVGDFMTIKNHDYILVTSGYPGETEPPVKAAYEEFDAAAREEIAEPTVEDESEEESDGEES